MTDRTVTVFTWDHRFGEWRLTTRRDGRPLVERWPELHVRLDDRGQPELVVPPAEVEV